MTPEGQKFMAKLRNFDSFGDVFPHFCPDKREVWHEGLCRGTPKFHVYRGNVSALWGEKPIFGPLNKNNTGMAVLRAGLPVITRQRDKTTIQKKKTRHTVRRSKYLQYNFIFHIVMQHLQTYPVTYTTHTWCNR